MTVADPEATAASFRQPFVGHLPGYPGISEAAGAEPPGEKVCFEVVTPAIHRGYGAHFLSHAGRGRLAAIETGTPRTVVAGSF